MCVFTCVCAGTGSPRGRKAPQTKAGNTLQHTTTRCNNNDEPISAGRVGRERAGRERGGRRGGGENEMAGNAADDDKSQRLRLLQQRERVLMAEIAAAREALAARAVGVWGWGGWTGWQVGGWVVGL